MVRWLGTPLSRTIYSGFFRDIVPVDSRKRARTEGPVVEEVSDDKAVVPANFETIAARLEAMSTVVTQGQSMLSRYSETIDTVIARMNEDYTTRKSELEDRAKAIKDEEAKAKKEIADRERAIQNEVTVLRQEEAKVHKRELKAGEHVFKTVTDELNNLQFITSFKLAQQFLARTERKVTKPTYMPMFCSWIEKKANGFYEQEGYSKPHELEVGPKDQTICAYLVGVREYSFVDNFIDYAIKEYAMAETIGSMKGVLSEAPKKRGRPKKDKKSPVINPADPPIGVLFGSSSGRVSPYAQLLTQDEEDAKREKKKSDDAYAKKMAADKKKREEAKGKISAEEEKAKGDAIIRELTEKREKEKAAAADKAKPPMLPIKSLNIRKLCEDMVID